MSKFMETANLIVLVAAVVVGIANIYKTFNSSARAIRNKQIEEIKEVVTTEATKYIEDVSGDLKEIKRNIKTIQDGNTDMLRREINKIYSKYRPYKKITQYDKIDIAKLSKDYFEEGGNSYVEDLLEQVSE